LFLALHFRRPSSLSANEREEKEKEKETGTKMHFKLVCCEGMLHINNINCIRGNTLMPSLVAAAAAAAA
jgi:hypothetical protein